MDFQTMGRIRESQRRFDLVRERVRELVKQVERGIADQRRALERLDWPAVTEAAERVVRASDELQKIREGA